MCLMSIILFQLIALFPSFQQQNYLDQVISFTKNYTISADLEYIIRKLSQGNSLVIGDTVKVNLQTQVINGDLNMPLPVEVLKGNGDISAESMELLYGYHNYKYMTLEEYYVNYTYTNKTKHSKINMNSYNFNFEKNYIGRCSYITSDVTFNTTIQELELSAYARYSYAYIGLIRNKPGVFLLVYLNGKVETLPLGPFEPQAVTNTTNGNNTNNTRLVLEDITSDTSELATTRFSNLWVVDQPYLQQAYLALQRATDSSLLLYEISLTNRTIALKFSTRVNFQDMPYLNITKIGIYNQNVLLGTKERGILKLIKNSKEWDATPIGGIIDEVNNRLRYMIITDFSINENTMYVIAQDYGLVIFSLSDLLNPIATYRHRYMLGLDYLTNPFLGNKYIGILMQNSNASNEFFLELDVNDEVHPKINKIFASNTTFLFNGFHTLDKFYSYLYDTNAKKVYVIRRGMVNSIPTESYILELDDAPNDLGGKIFSIFQWDSEKHIPMIMAASSTLVLNSITFPKDIFNCTFSSPGRFVIKFSLIGEVCASSIVSSIGYTTCQRYIDYTYDIYGTDNSEIITVITVVSVVICLCLGTAIFITAWKTKCFRKWDHFKIQTAPVKREDIYAENEEEDNKKLDEEIINKNHWGGSAGFELGTYAHGKVYGNVIKDLERELPQAVEHLHINKIAVMGKETSFKQAFSPQAVDEQQLNINQNILSTMKQGAMSRPRKKKRLTANNPVIEKAENILGLGTETAKIIEPTREKLSEKEFSSQKDSMKQLLKVEKIEPLPDSQNKEKKSNENDSFNLEDYMDNAFEKKQEKKEVRIVENLKNKKPAAAGGGGGGGKYDNEFK